MGILTHQIITHPDYAEPFRHERSFTPYEPRVGFSWFLYPVTIAKASEWLLVNGEFGYCELVIAPSKDALHIGDTAISAVEYHLPADREEDNVSVSLSGDDVSWHTTEKVPEHVGKRCLMACALFERCRDINQADEALEALNDTPLTLHGRTFTPTEGMEGLLRELADDFRDYIEHTPWWKQCWHRLAGKAPWLDRRNS